MHKKILLFILLFIPTSAFATVQVKAIQGQIVKVCQPSDPNTSCGGGSGASPGGSNTQVQYNSSGSFAGNAGFVYSGGNVGIGSATPTQALDVAGTVRADAFSPKNTITYTCTGTSDDVGIQADLNNAAYGRTLVNGSVCQITATVSVPGNGFVFNTPGKTLEFDSATTIKPSSNIDMFNVGQQANLIGHNTYVDSHGVTGYTHAFVHVLGVNNITYARVSGFFVYGGAATAVNSGYGFLLDSNANSAAIEQNVFEDTTFWGVGFPIYMKADTGFTGENNNNANTFSNIFIEGCIQGIHNFGHDTQSAQGNFFLGIQIENSDPTDAVAAMDVDYDVDNTYDVYPFDFNATNKILIAGSNSKWNWFNGHWWDDVRANGNTSYYTDNSGGLNHFEGIYNQSFRSVLDISNGSGGDADLLFKGNGAANFIVGNETAGGGAESNFNIYSYGVSGDVFNIKRADGNVGIGSVNPGGSLDVGNGSICLGHVCDSSWPTGTSQWSGTSGSNLSYSGGNVGIDSVTPGQALDVQGTVRSTGLVVTGTGTGNVGINSATPGQRLDVVGTVRATAFIAGSTAGVSCSGSPTASFASVNGVVTHC